MKGFMRWTLGFVFVSLLSAGALLASAQWATAAYKTEYKLSVVPGATSGWGLTAARFAELVNERTNGRINIKVYPSSQLLAGKQTSEFLMLRNGAIDFALASPINWSPQIKELNLFALPFLMPDYAAADALTQGEVGKDLFAIISKRGVVPLAWGENGAREIKIGRAHV